MTKFKVGDKAKVVALNDKIATATGAKIGEVVEIADIIDHFAGRNFRCKYSESKASGLGYFSAEALEKLPQTPTKNQRITTLESEVSGLTTEVAELKAKVEALEKAQLSGPGTVYLHGKPIGKIDAIAALSKSPNRKRKAIIAEAKAFVETKTHYMQDSSLVKGGWAAKERENPNFCDYLTKAEFIVNREKRTVVALIRYEHGSDLKAKGIAKCAPDDVFNADIGKAIALGRALGLDVSRFEQAVKPTEIIAGMRVKYADDKPTYGGETRKVTKVVGAKLYYSNGGNFRLDLRDPAPAIIDDTEAVY